LICLSCWKQVTVRLPDHHRGANAGVHFALPVDQQISAGDIFQVYGNGNIIEDKLQAALGFAQFLGHGEAHLQDKRQQAIFRKVGERYQVIAYRELKHKAHKEKHQPRSKGNASSALEAAAMAETRKQSESENRKQTAPPCEVPGSRKICS